jgi:hypothetical protein
MHVRLIRGRRGGFGWRRRLATVFHFEEVDGHADAGRRRFFRIVRCQLAGFPRRLLERVNDHAVFKALEAERLAVVRIERERRQEFRHELVQVFRQASVAVAIALGSHGGNEAAQIAVGAPGGRIDLDHGRHEEPNDAAVRLALHFRLQRGERLPALMDWQSGNTDYLAVQRQ